MSTEEAMARFQELLANAAVIGFCLCAFWLTVGIASSALAQLPGWVGRLCDPVSVRLAPRLVRHLTAITIGSVIATLAPGAQRALADAGAATCLAVVSLDRPTAPPLPCTTRASQRPPSIDRPAEVTVARGDTLWAIAQSRLGASATNRQVAREWPRWYATNRAVIGANPDLIIPGQRLHAPQD